MAAQERAVKVISTALATWEHDGDGDVQVTTLHVNRARHLLSLIGDPLDVGDEDNPNPIRAMYNLALTITTLHASGEEVPEHLFAALNAAGDAIHDRHAEALEV